MYSQFFLSCSIKYNTKVFTLKNEPKDKHKV